MTQVASSHQGGPSLMWDESGAGAVVARMLLGPVRLRDMEFVVRVSQLWDQPGLSEPASAKIGPTVGTRTLAVQDQS